MENAMTPLKIAIYSRVSTDKQDTENQLVELRREAATKGWNVVAEFIDTATGGTSDREQFQQMFQAADRREFELLLFWSLDRLSREGTLQTLQHLDKLAKSGVGYRSLQEAYLDTTNPMNDVFVAFAAVRAREEKKRIGERTRAGLAIARARGVKLGRPVRIFDLQRASRMLADGISKRQVSRSLNIPLSTLLDRVAAEAA
jgi:DNA invertase Pin-like site-specific DNA recombinase